MNENYPNYQDSNNIAASEGGLFDDLVAVKYGTFWERFAAAFIDGILITIVVRIVEAIFGIRFTYSSGVGFNGEFIGAYFKSSVVSVTLGWLYEAMMISGEKQATIGKMAVGLKVTDMQGNRVSFLNATGRHFGKLLSTIILFIGYLMMTWDDKRQTLHDKLAGTLVIKK